MTARVRTVLGDVEPEDLGFTYIHEHLIIDTPLVIDRWPHIHLPSVDEAVSELELCASAGVGAFVDAMPAASGRGPLRLAEASRRSGVHVIACTGLHTSKYYEGQRWTVEEPADVLAKLFIADVVDGIDRYDYMGPVIRRTPHRAGILKVAVVEDAPTPRDIRVFEAAAMAHDATGVPILTHCEGGRGAIAQIELFERLGVPLDRVVISHTDKVPDLSYHRELLDAGVYLEYDQALRQGEDAAEGTGRIVAAMVEEGHADRLMLSTDGARRSLWTSLGGGPGLAWLATRFVEILESLGVEQASINTMFVENPARFLPFAPDS
ncbi:MAG: aryldialkylphosphatase [Actinomycetota bacterium]|nr:aryldialkylphosphatase [Actinomycetota bacterium]